MLNVISMDYVITPCMFATISFQIFGTCSHCGQLITGEKQRVEIAIPTTVNSSKFSLSYDSHGVAKLHNSCWKVVHSVSYPRSHFKKSFTDNQLSLSFKCVPILTDHSSFSHFSLLPT